MRKKMSRKFFSLALVLLFSLSFLPGPAIYAEENVDPVPVETQSQDTVVEDSNEITEEVLAPETLTNEAELDTDEAASDEIVVEEPEADEPEALEMSPLDVDDSTKEIVLDYYSINDFHGNVDNSGSSKNPGLARIQTFLNNQKAINPNTYFLSSGDHYQGTAISNLTKGEVITEIFNEMGLYASAIGNHEFDFGSDLIPVWAKDGGYTFLASNIEIEEDKKPTDWDEYVKPYIIQEVEVDGQTIKVGFIGIATPETAYKTAAENVVGYTFTDPVEATNKYTKILKDQGADAILSLTHLGGFQAKDGSVSGEVVDYANKINDVDGIFLGHTHQFIEGEVNGIPVVQGGYNGRNISKIALNFTVDAGKVTLGNSEGKVINLTDMIPDLVEDPTIKAIVDKYYEELKPVLEEKLGDLEVNLPHDTSSTVQVTPMGQFVGKAMAEAGETQIAIINGGGIRRGFEKGSITMGLMYELLPFDNALVTLKVTGAKLKELVEHGLYSTGIKSGQFYGLTIVQTKNAEPGKRITEMRLLDGKLIKDDGVYSVSTLDFIFTGGDKYDFNGATDVVETYIPVRDMVADYIKTEKVVGEEFVNPMKTQYNLDYFSINDLHGNVDSSGSSSNPGLARIQTYLNQQRAFNPDTYFVSAGDHFQGTAISNLTEGEVVNEILKEMGLLTSAVGNHEFDFGTDKIPVWAEEGSYKFLASNIEVDAAYKPAQWDDFVVPYMIQEVVVEGKTVKIGFIGIATPETKYKTAAENVIGFTFTDPVAATNKYSKILKDQGVEAIISLTHLGGFQEDGEISGEVVDYANGVNDIDGIFLGHTHQLIDGVVNGIPVVQGRYNGRNLSNISLVFDVLEDEITFEGSKGKVIDIRAMISQLDEDPAVKAIVDKYTKELEPILNEELAVLETDLPHNTDEVQVSTMGQFVSKYLAEAGGTQIAILNGGGIRRGFEKGIITMGLMYELLPFDNALVTLNLSGAELKKLIEHGLYPEDFRPGQFYGLKVWYDKDAAKGERVTSMRLLDGTLIEDDKMYSVSTLDFLLTGGDNYDFSKAEDVVETFVPVRDLIADRIEEEGVISYTYQEHLIQGQDDTVIEDDDKDKDDDKDQDKDKDKDKLPAAGAAGAGIYYAMGMMSLLSAGVIARKMNKKDA